MAKFAYNNTKNRNTSYTFFELNYKYHFFVFYQENFDSCSKSKVVKKLSAELEKLI